MSLLDRIKQALGIRSPSKFFMDPIKEIQELPQAEPCGRPTERTSEPMTYKLGSLFDGSGGFPLAGSLCGIVPVWAAEVEPYPIAVTRSRFPNMRHLGDISKVNGAEIEPVDVITFGSPCQDLSVAGKRAGLKHEANGDEETTRSGLFMEAVRIIKEMREATNGIYPKFALWENVPGAFSSNKGEDFRIVLQELIQIVEPAAVMPAVPKSGWAYADSYCGDGWSLAYRVFDAQYWGVPQRRRRIHLVIDFGGERAGKILFERDGLRGYFEASRTPWQGIAAAPQDGPGATDFAGEYTAQSYGWPLGFRPENTRVHKEVSTTLCNGTRPGFTCGIIKEQYLFENHSQDTRYKGPMDVCPMLPAQLGTGGNNTPFVVEKKTDCIVFDKETYNSGKNSTAVPYIAEQGPAPTLRTDGHPPGVCVRYIVRRLTPTECARLQGFADNWGHIDQKETMTPEEYAFWLEVRNTHAAINGKAVKEYTEKQMLTWYNKLHTDSAEYKMWGNGIALPPALYCMQGIADQLAARAFEYKHQEELL